MDTGKYLPRGKAAISLEVKRPEHESHQSPPSEIKKEHSHTLYCTSSVEANVFRCSLSINLHAARRRGIQCTEFVTNSYTHQQPHSTAATLTSSYTHQQPHSPAATLTNSYTHQQLHSPTATLTSSHTHQQLHSPTATFTSSHTHQQLHSPAATLTTHSDFSQRHGNSRKEIRFDFLQIRAFRFLNTFCQ